MNTQIKKEQKNGTAKASTSTVKTNSSKLQTKSKQENAKLSFEERIQKVDELR